MDASLYPAFKAAIAAETDPTFVALRQANETGQMAAWYNGAYSPSFTVWRSVTLAQSVFNAVNWAAFTPVDVPDGTALYTNRAMAALLAQQNLMTLLQSNTPISTGLTNVRKLLSDACSLSLFTGASGAAQNAGWLGASGVKQAICRTITRAEKVWATGTGTSGAPGDLGAFEGVVTNDDIVNALRS